MKRYVYAVYENGKRADSKGFKIDKGEGRDNSKFQTEEEAQEYLKRWLRPVSNLVSFPVPLNVKVPIQQNEFVEIRKETVRGRPSGSNSFVTVKMRDLAQFVGPEGVIKVSKVWLQDIGLAIKEAVAEIEATEEKQGEDLPPIEFKTVDFD